MLKYNKIKCIGRGAVGTAWLCEEKSSGEQRVIKMVTIAEMSEDERRQAGQEVLLLSKLDHPSVVKYYEAFIEGPVLHIVMAYCEHGDLAGLIKKRASSDMFLDEDQILDWFAQLTVGIAYIHSKKILHRDLKTQNVFVTSNNCVKLGDFGIARVLDSTLEQAKTVVGTPYYMSPEVCESKPYSFKSDLWALGCILYEMCTLKHAFESSNLLGLVVKIVQDKAPPVPDRYSRDLRAIVANLLSKDANERMDTTQICDIPIIRARIARMAESGGTMGHIAPAPVSRTVSMSRNERLRAKRDAVAEQERAKLEAAREENAHIRQVVMERRTAMLRPSHENSTPLSTGDTMMKTSMRSPAVAGPPTSRPLPSARGELGGSVFGDRPSARSQVEYEGQLRSDSSFVFAGDAHQPSPARHNPADERPILGTGRYAFQADEDEEPERSVSSAASGRGRPTYSSRHFAHKAGAASDSKLTSPARISATGGASGESRSEAGNRKIAEPADDDDRPAYSSKHAEDDVEEDGDEDDHYSDDFEEDDGEYDDEVADDTLAHSKERDDRDMEQLRKQFSSMATRPAVAVAPASPAPVSRPAEEPVVIRAANLSRMTNELRQRLVRDMGEDNFRKAYNFLRTSTDGADGKSVKMALSSLLNNDPHLLRLAQDVDVLIFQESRFSGK